MAQTNNSSVTYDYIPPTSPIQRILIAHLNLYELCENGKSLGENASLEEISEEILFYHRGTPIHLTAGEDEEWNLTHTIGNGSCIEEAVAFLGICKALYALPSSLNTSHPSRGNGQGGDDSGVESDDDDDRTNSIYFGNSILVFVPLESTLSVVAIVQVSRQYQNGVKSDTGSGNPLAISASIERTHRLFCILRGGGIIHRLDEKSENSTCRYPRMKKLFDLLKEIRTAKESLPRQGGSSISNENDAEEITHRIAELDMEVKSFRETLPIQSLRQDLETHYNEYLNYFLEVCLRNGGAGRCLVEMIPVPIAQDSGSHIFQSPPSKIEERHFESIQESIRQILQSHSRTSMNDKDPDPSLLGIAIFEGSRLLHSFSNSERIDLSYGTVSLLMPYMASYRTKMRSSSLLEPRPGLLKRLAYHLGPMADKTSSHTAVPKKWEETDASNNLLHKSSQQRGQFLPAPPPFMLGASDDLHSLRYGNIEQGIWAPRVHLPLAVGTNLSGNKDVITDDRLIAHMVVFEFLQFSFLIFINTSSLENAASPELPETELILTDLEEKLSEAIIGAFQNEPESISDNLTNEPGQDIVLIERSKERMVLLLDPNLQSPRSNQKKRAVFGNKEKSQMRRFMDFRPRKEENVSQSQPTSHRSTTIEWSTLGLDCRHLFASRLPLDICLAFDDMINEVRISRPTIASSLSKGDGNDDKFSSSMFELCTCMPHGWIYALAMQETEIYVFFDNSIYVTLSDVQSAVLRIKERYIAQT